MAATTTVVTQTPPEPLDLGQKEAPTSPRDKTAVISDLIKIIESEYTKGNHTVTEEKYAAFLQLREVQRKNSKSPKPQASSSVSAPALPAPLYPPIFQKFRLPQSSQPQKKTHTRRKQQPWSLKYIENTLITVLESVASILDNLHLLSKMPLFPKGLVHVLTHTNRIWVLILVFLIRKTISQLLNVRRKEHKVASELAILRSNSNAKLLEKENAGDENSIFRKYEKVLKDLSFDKNMLKIELLGNLLDLAFNVIEMYALPVPGWFMSTLNFASMAMTIYRMNKDDEYTDDNVAEDLI